MRAQRRRAVSRAVRTTFARLITPFRACDARQRGRQRRPRRHVPCAGMRPATSSCAGMRPASRGDMLGSSRLPPSTRPATSSHGHRVSRATQELTMSIAALAPPGSSSQIWSPRVAPMRQRHSGASSLTASYSMPEINRNRPHTTPAGLGRAPSTRLEYQDNAYFKKRAD